MFVAVLVTAVICFVVGLIACLAAYEDGVKDGLEKGREEVEAEQLQDDAERWRLHEEQMRVFELEQQAGVDPEWVTTLRTEIAQVHKRLDSRE